MTTAQKAQLKTAMENKKAELEELLIEYKKDSVPLGLDSAIGRISRMDYINNKSVVESGIRKAEQDIQSLERWLSMYESDKFGKCTRCANEININRLLLMPASTRCIHCAGK